MNINKFRYRRYSSHSMESHVNVKMSNNPEVHSQQLFLPLLKDLERCHWSRPQTPPVAHQAKKYGCRLAKINQIKYYYKDRLICYMESMNLSLFIMASSKQEIFSISKTDHNPQIKNRRYSSTIECYPRCPVI